MVVGAARIELHIHGSQSLKQKRGVVRSITRRVANRFNAAVAEVEGQDTWEWAVLGVATVGIDAVAVHRRLDHVVAFIEDLHLAEVIDSEVEVAAMPMSIDSAAEAFDREERTE